MRIKCPKCGKVLYTNPFGTNKVLDCPYCVTRLVKVNPAVGYIRKYYLLDALIMGGLALAAYLLFDMRLLSILALFNLICDILFEVPQRNLYRSGVLQFVPEQKEASSVL